MGLNGGLLGGLGSAAEIGRAVKGVAEVFRPNATRAMELEHGDFRAALSQHADEFRFGRAGMFDRIVNALNRLPRPFLALGTLGLFVFAMVDPAAFARRMEGLALVPDPLWWLLAAIVSFYFGARELHYARTAPQPRRAQSVRGSHPGAPGQPASGPKDAAAPRGAPGATAGQGRPRPANAAIADWMAGRRGP